MLELPGAARFRSVRGLPYSFNARNCSSSRLGVDLARRGRQQAREAHPVDERVALRRIAEGEHRLCPSAQIRLWYRTATTAAAISFIRSWWNWAGQR
ncbi:hypothetical protein SANTM175S_04099 [Streptomyces antimycoticus]